MINAVLDIADAADYIGMSRQWLYRNLTIVPHLRIGFGVRPRIKFRQSDLDSWLASRIIDQPRRP